MKVLWSVTFMQVKENKKLVQLRLSRELEYKLRIEAAKQGRPKSALLEEAVELYLRTLEGKSHAKR
ncbi:hypothetical protein [Thermosynechococcus sp. FA-CM-4201]